MKLTVVGPSYPYKSGISHFTTILVGKLRKHHEVDFINWKRQYPKFLYPLEQEDKGSKQVLVEDNVRLLDFYNPVSWLRAAWRVRKHRSERLIVTWVSVAQTPPYLGIILASKLFGRARVTYLCHNVLPHDPLFFEGLFLKIMLRLADDFIVHSSKDCRDLARLAPGKPVKVGFHPTYDDFNTGQRYDTGKLKRELGLRRKVVLFFGFIRPYKGLHYLIEAMAQVKAALGDDIRDDVSLLVVGEFWKKNKPEYEASAARHGVLDSVVFVDRYVPNEEVGMYFAVSDILAAPYVSATQSGVVQMAYAFDTPVVVTNVGGLPEAVEEGVTGFVCEPENVPALAAAIIKALNHHDYDMAAAKTRFSWENYIHQTGLLETEG